MYNSPRARMAAADDVGGARGRRDPDAGVVATVDFYNVRERLAQVIRRTALRGRVFNIRVGSERERL